MPRGGDPQDMEIVKSGRAVAMKMQAHAISATTRFDEAGEYPAERVIQGLIMLVFVSRTIDTFKTPWYELRKNDREGDIGRVSDSTVGFSKICCERSNAVPI